MDFSALEPVSKQTTPGGTPAVGVRSDLFSDILLGIADPAQDDAFSDEHDTNDEAHADETEAEAKAGSAIAGEAKLILDTHEATALASDVIAPAGNATPPHLSPASDAANAAPSSEAATSQTATTATLENAAGATGPAAQQAAAAQTAENKVLAKRTGAIEANTAHADRTKAQLAAASGAGKAQANATSNAKAAETAAAPAKSVDISAPTSDIARIDQALRQAFQAPQSAAAALPGTTSPTANSPILGASSEALLSGRAVDAAVDGTNAANSNTRANAVATAKVATARPALNLPNGRPAEQVSVQVQNGIRNGADRIHIKLSPATLGNVEVKLEVAPDKTVQAIVYADKAETLDMLERDGRVLQKALEEAGLRTGSDSLSFEQRGSGEPDSTLADNADDRSDGKRGAGTGHDDADTDTAELPVQIRKSHDGLIDIEA